MGVVEFDSISQTGCGLPLTNITDESRTMLRNGLTTGVDAPGSHQWLVGLAALPFAF
jgi:hypothetical protein